MRKVILQMQQTLDGFVAAPDGALDWMTWNWDDDLNAFVRKLTESMDLILLGRKLAQEFIPYWQQAHADPSHPEHPFSHKMVETPKRVFSSTLTSNTPATSSWAHTTFTSSGATEEISNLRKQPGANIIVYGGASFVSSLVDQDLIDELYLFVHPVAIGQGLRIFPGRKNLHPVENRSFPCGIQLLHYQPQKQQS